MLLEPTFCIRDVQIHMQPDKSLIEILDVKSFVNLLGFYGLIRTCSVKPICTHHAVNVRTVGEGLSRGKCRYSHSGQ